MARGQRQAQRRCLDCGNLTIGSRCSTCRSARERERGTAAERGYDSDWRHLLATDPAYLAATTCAACGEAFTPSNPKTGGHRVALRDGGRGSGVVAHCRRCNSGWRATGL